MLIRMVNAFFAIGYFLLFSIASFLPPNSVTTNSVIPDEDLQIPHGFQLARLEDFRLRF